MVDPKIKALSDLGLPLDEWDISVSFGKSMFHSTGSCHFISVSVKNLINNKCFEKKERCGLTKNAARKRATELIKTLILKLR